MDRRCSEQRSHLLHWMEHFAVGLHSRQCLLPCFCMRTTSGNGRKFPPQKLKPSKLLAGTHTLQEWMPLTYERRFLRMFPRIAPVEVVPNDAFHDQMVRGGGRTPASANIDLPLRREEKIDYRKKLLLLIVQ